MRELRSLEHSQKINRTFLWAKYFREANTLLSLLLYFPYERDDFVKNPISQLNKNKNIFADPPRLHDTISSSILCSEPGQSVAGWRPQRLWWRHWTRLSREEMRSFSKYFKLRISNFWWIHFNRTDPSNRSCRMKVENLIRNIWCNECYLQRRTNFPFSKLSPPCWSPTSLLFC